MGTESVFSVYFDGAFWVGVLEVIEDREIRAAKFVFGAEPTPAELWEFARNEGNRLIDEVNGAPRLTFDGRQSTRPVRNPKKLARESAKQQQDSGVTRSRAALAAAKALNANERNISKRERRAADEDKRRAARIAKRKAKHRGR